MARLQHLIASRATVVLEKNGIEPVIARRAGGFVQEIHARERRECVSIALREPPFRGDELVKLLQLGDPERGIKIGQPVVPANLVVQKGPFVLRLRGRGQMLCPAGKDRIVGQNRAAPASRDDLIAVKAQHAGGAEAAAGPAAIAAAQGFGRVLDDRQAEFGADTGKRIHIRRMTENMDRHNSADHPARHPVHQPVVAPKRNLRQMTTQLYWIDAEALRLAVDEVRDAAAIGYRIGCGDEGQRRNNHFVISADAGQG